MSMTRMKIVFRADASIEIGSGHIMRCLTLAKELSVKGACVEFACVPLPGNLIALIRQAGFFCHELSDIQAVTSLNGDWLVVDHYQLDFMWETAIRPKFSKIMVIDDLANREHNCDILLDQNYYINMNKRYDKLVPSSCKKLLGPQYALLRNEFIVAHKNILKSSRYIKRILVFFGGSDFTNDTMKAIQAIKDLSLTDVIIDVVVGTSNPNRHAIEETCRQMPNCIYHCQVNNMAELMSKADFAIGAGGSASWERCYLGLPTISIIVASNQEQLVNDLERFGAIISLGHSSSVTSDILAESIRRILYDHELREKISRKCLELMSQYKAGAVSDVLLESQ